MIYLHRLKILITPGPGVITPPNHPPPPPLDGTAFLGNAGFEKTISLKHFELLSRYFHISITGHEEATRQIKKDEVTCFKAWKCFLIRIYSQENISIDEGLVKFNGRLSFKPYIRKKPE